MCVKTLWLYFRNAWRETIIEFQRFLNCVLSFVSFVKILFGLIMPGMRSTSTYFDWWNYQTIFSWRFRCLMPFDVTEAVHWTEALLSLNILVQEYAFGIPISLSRCLSDCSSVDHALVTMISASQELNDVCFWRMDFHSIGPPERQIRKYERDCSLNNSSGVPSLTALSNWPPQFSLQ